MVFSASSTVRLPSQGPAPPKYIRGFCFWRDASSRQGASANGPEWAAPKKHRQPYPRRSDDPACLRGTGSLFAFTGETRRRETVNRSLMGTLGRDAGRGGDSKTFAITPWGTYA